MGLFWLSAGGLEFFVLLPLWVMLCGMVNCVEYGFMTVCLNDYRQLLSERYKHL